MSDLTPEQLHDAGVRCDLPVSIAYVESTGSTNADLRALARQGAPHGTALVADHQSAGRGRFERVWQSPPGCNLYLSVLLRREIEPRHIGLVALAAGVATAQAARAGTALKWPNDLLAADGRKVGGLLAERAADGSWIVVGIGVNVRWAPAELPAASLLELGVEHSRSELAARITAGLLTEVELVMTEPSRVLAHWRDRAHTLGRAVRVGTVSGLAVDVDSTGALLVRTESGRVQKILAGDVEMVAQEVSQPPLR